MLHFSGMLPGRLLLCSLGQDFGYVHDADRLSLAAQQTIEVHQARHVGRGNYLAAGLLMIVNSIEAHHARDGFFAYGKCTAEPATFVRPL